MNLELIKKIIKFLCSLLAATESATKAPEDPRVVSALSNLEAAIDEAEKSLKKK